MASSIEIDVSANIAKFKAGMDKAAAEGSALNKKLGRSFRSIKKVMTGVGALAGIAVGGGIATLGKKAIDAADQIQKLGIRTGASAEFLSEMRLALSQADVSSTDFENSLKKLNKSTQDGLDGLSTTTRAFDKLGINLDSFSKLNTDQKFIAISEAISRIEDPSIRGQVSMDLLGRSGTQLLTVMDDGAAGIANYREKAIELGHSLSQDQVNAAAAANDALDLLSKSISGGFSQAILQYTDQIKTAADFTREYLPRAIEFLMDIFRGLKAVVQGVALSILNVFSTLSDAAAKLPGAVGEHFKKTGDFFKTAASVIQDQLKDNVDQMGKWKDSADKANKEAGDFTNRLKRDLAPALSVIGKATDSAGNKIETAAEKTKRLGEEAKKTASSIKALERGLDDFRDAIPDKMTGRLADSLKRVQKETFQATVSQIEFDKALKDGVIVHGKEAAAVAAELGVEYVNLGDNSETVKELMLQGWKDLQSGIQSSFYNALRSGQNFFDSLKNIAFDILAQIAAKIATTFVINNLLGGGTGGAWGTALSAILGGGNGGGNGGGGLGSIASTALSGTKLGSYLGIGGSGALATGGAAGVTTATGVSTALAAGYTGAALAIGGGTAAGAGTGAFLTASQAAAGLSAGGAAGGAAATGSGIGAAVAAIPGWGWAIIGAAAIAGIVGSGARSPQQIGLDQLQAVDQSARAGNFEQVANIGGSGVSYLGSFNEASAFYGAAGISKTDLDKVGNILKQRYGFDQAFGLKDGILRLVDEDRKFSVSHEQITTEVLTAIREVQDANDSTIKSMEAVSVASNSSFSSIGNDAEQAAGKFKLSFGDGLNEVVQKSGQAAYAFGESFRFALKDVNAEFLSTGDMAVEQTLRINDSINTTSTGVNRLDQETRQVIGSVDRLTQSIQNQTDQHRITQAQAQPLFGT